MGMMSTGEFARMAREDGASRRLLDKGEPQMQGYFVSRHPELPVRQGGSPTWSLDVPDLSTGALSKVIRQHWKEVRQPALRSDVAPPEEAHQGGWMEDGRSMMLDVSDRFPRTLSGLIAATHTAIRNKQQAIFAAHAGTSLRLWHPHNLDQVPPSLDAVMAEAEKEHGQTVSPHVLIPSDLQHRWQPS